MYPAISKSLVEENTKHAYQGMTLILRLYLLGKHNFLLFSKSLFMIKGFSLN